MRSLRAARRRYTTSSSSVSGPRTATAAFSCARRQAILSPVRSISHSAAN
jgi:hypothetical protein